MTFKDSNHKIPRRPTANANRVPGNKSCRFSSLLEWLVFLDEKLQGTTSPFKLHLFVCLFTCISAHTHQCVRSQRVTCRSWFFPSTACALRIKQVVILDGEHPYTLIYVAIPWRNNFSTQKNLSKVPSFKLTMNIPFPWLSSTHTIASLYHLETP